MRMKDNKENKTRVIELREKEIKVIRNLIWEKQEQLDYEKDNLDDPEYGVLYHIKNGLLQSLLDKYFYE